MRLSFYKSSGYPHAASAGSQVSKAVHHYTLPGSQSLAIVCVAPPMSAHDGRAVAVRLSIDGALYSVAGAVFYYHAPLMIDAVSPEGASSGLGGGVQMMISLHNGGGGLFGPGFDADSVTVPASCAFGDTEVPAEFVPGTYQVRHLSSQQRRRRRCSLTCMEWFAISRMVLLRRFLRGRCV